jgi:hypothetical protein
MPEPTPALPFAYRLSPDVAARIQGTPPRDTPLVELRSPHRRLVVLVLVLGLLGGGFATGLSTSEAQAMRNPDCGPGWVVDALGNVTADQNRNC